MPSLALPADPKFVIAAAVGVVLVALARWASRIRGSKLDSWVALRSGDVLFTEIVDAFLLGCGLGGLIAEPDAVAVAGSPGRIGPPGRFGGLGPNLPLTLGIVGAAVSVLTRLELNGIVLRGSSPRNGLNTYIGWEARVIAPIPAGGLLPDRDARRYGLSALGRRDGGCRHPAGHAGTRHRHKGTEPRRRSHCVVLKATLREADLQA